MQRVLEEKKKKAVILLSGGLDSATALAIAKDQGYDCYALSFRYGQRHAQELIAAKAVAFLEALQPEFKQYQQQVLANARAMAGALQKRVADGEYFDVVVIPPIPIAPLLGNRVDESSAKELARAGIGVGIKQGAPVPDLSDVDGFKKAGKKLDMGKCCVRFKKIEDAALDVIGEAFRTKGIVDAGLRTKIGRGTTKLSRPLPHAAEHLGQILRTHDDERHEDHNDELREAESEHLCRAGIQGSTGRADESVLWAKGCDPH